MSKLITSGRMILLIIILVTATACRAENPGPAREVPEFSQTELDNYKGTAVVLNFWAIWCSPCRSEMPALEAVYQEYQDQKFVVLAVNVSESSTEVGKFAASRNLTFPIFWDPDQRSMKSYEIRSLPTTLFINRDGQIITRHVGAVTESYLKGEVEPLLQ